MSDVHETDNLVEDPPVEILPLDAWHRARGARMVEFAGYHMPIQYEGIMVEHQWTREQAGLFDVSHMGQLLISGLGVTEALEALLPADLVALKEGRIRYSLLLDEDGGILDDLMITRLGPEEFYMVVNGATKWDDIGHLREHLPDEITLNHLDEQALLALQGPAAASVLERVLPGVANTLSFMQGTSVEWRGAMIGVGRSGYTGEDGFELSVSASHITLLADALCEQPEVKPIGLGARDSLRLEAGLPLYGHDLDPGIDPVEADLGFAISKRRREQGGFPGAARVLAALRDGPARRRVGLAIDGRLPAREGAEIFAGARKVGVVTSGGFSPSVGAPIAMGTVDASHAAVGTSLEIEVRGKRIAAKVAPMPFVPHRYHRQKN